MAARGSSPRNMAIRQGFTALLAVSGRNGSRRTTPASVRRFYGMENRRERIAFQGSETGIEEWYWLQNKVEDSTPYFSDFAIVSGRGRADYGNASCFNGVRPVFLLS